MDNQEVLQFVSGAADEVLVVPLNSCSKIMVQRDGIRVEMQNGDNPPVAKLHSDETVEDMVRRILPERLQKAALEQYEWMLANR